MKPEYKTSEAQRRASGSYVRNHKDEIKKRRDSRTPEQKARIRAQNDASRANVRMAQTSESQAVRVWMAREGINAAKAAEIFSEFLGRRINAGAVYAYRAGTVWIPEQVLDIVGYVAEN